MRFDRDFLAALEQLRFATTRTFPGAGRGDRRGRQRGRGLEFADYRPYAQGDDFRHIDWKAYRRLGRLLVRLFDEEQDLRVYLFVDTSRSMASGGKFDYAVRLAGALCYVGLAHLDRVSVFPFADTLGAESTPGAARRAIGPVFDRLDALQADGGTDLWRAVSQFAERPRRAGMAIVMSDFLDGSGASRPLKLLASRGHEVVALHVVAAADRTGHAELDEVILVDAETGDRRRVDVTPALLAAYRESWESHDREVEAASKSAPAHYLKVDVGVPFERVVLHTLRLERVLE